MNRNYVLKSHGLKTNINNWLRGLTKKSKKKSVKSQIKKVSLESAFQNINSLCSPEALWQAVPQTWATVIKQGLTVGFCSNIWDN